MALTETIQLTCGLKNANTASDIFGTKTREYTKIEQLNPQVVIDSALVGGHSFDLTNLTDIDLLFFEAVYYETNAISGVTEGQDSPFVIKFSTATLTDQEIPCKGTAIIPLSQTITALSVSTTSSDKVQIRLYANCKTV